MLDLAAYLFAGSVLIAIALGSWLVSLVKDDVSIVDSVWSLMFLAAAAVYAANIELLGARATLVLALVAIWAVRLAAHIAWRNHGRPEDHRYQQIRANNQPGFRYKSVYLVFGLQAALAWLISLPLLVGISAVAPLGVLDFLGVCLWLIGLIFEAVGDWQLARFLRNRTNDAKVLDSGLWAYTRHPNYFGEFLLWWGFYLIAAGAGGWWTVLSPLLMTLLLLKVSGVSLLEKDIADRRPEYADYIRRTNAFFPGLPRVRSTRVEQANRLGSTARDSKLSTRRIANSMQDARSADSRAGRGDIATGSQPGAT